ncbi:branched-chain amino acid ABC transporter substrate-binding protein [Sinorhizobium medicae]|nr:ABC transporter substrate-binding protein [Sinorhizobium medicae]MDX1162869.1 ABC transporter substrate-binding protein [Sinorhizobium medicae]PLT96828.1 branched-chain amino acid ABC transporter substrate-binding protein [Sinorhizobium medicae]PLU16772.1 branched-chain amino acid ABC transporter substrate-binding protein [Sinorhizobium medicae]PLU37491.1 branched-chain amino acid ABC transporter substrate-binding protein [Sinorhizobium medicae]
MLEAIPGRVRSGFPSGIAEKRTVRATPRFREKGKCSNLSGLLALFWVAMLVTSPSQAAEVKTAVLRIDRVVGPPISRLDAPPADLGFAGAMLGNEDNRTTGAFTGMDYTVKTQAAAPEEAGAALDGLKAEGIGLIAVIAEGDILKELSEKAGPEVLLFNAGARDDGLRDADCLANVLHVSPSRSMLSDSIVQFLMWKKWPRILLIHGSHPEDRLLAESYRKSAAKFGAEIVEEREFVDTGGGRRTDTGHVMVQKQIPVFTQEAEAYDVIVAADEAGVFAPYLPYHSWDPRPIAGSAGLRPVSWHPAHEAWGATQFQRRFEKLTGRYMREEDYQAWLAMRVIGEAVTRSGKADPATVRAYALSKDFELAAFKGQKLTFRTWNGQLRQPVLLTEGRVTVSVSPQDGYLHQHSPLDTLGIDAPETACQAFGG